MYFILTGTWISRVMALDNTAGISNGFPKKKKRRKHTDFTKDKKLSVIYWPKYACILY